ERGGQRGARSVRREHHVRPGTARPVDGVPRQGRHAERTGTCGVRDALLSRSAPGRDRPGARVASAQGELPVDRGGGEAGRGVGRRSLSGRANAGPLAEERSVDPIPESETLLELLVRWEELRRQGKTATPEELCPNDARLQALLRERLARRQRLYAALDLPGAAGHEPVARPAALPVIDGYEIGELLGRGGMGLVVKAVQKALKR